MSTIFSAPAWLDLALYPFEHRTIQLASGQMHYVDEGEGAVILFVHGTPTWSFLYRDFIRTLSTKYRCIAIDHLGFGLSEKPADFSGTPQAHAKNLSEFIRRLDLKEITLVVHDFGGPIGLGSAIENPEKIKQLVLFNTWLWETRQDREVQKVDRIVTSRLGRFLYLNLNFSPRILLKQGFADKKNLSKKVHRHYLKPYPDKASRNPLLKLARALAGSSDWYQQQWTKLELLEDKPWLILWGTKDKFITLDRLDKWTLRKPAALIRKFECGHFVQEEKSRECIKIIDKFMIPEITQTAGSTI